MTTTRTLLRTTLRVCAAALVLAGGFIHIRVWQQKYKDLPAGYPGRWVVRTGFPVNAVASALIALALIAIGFSLFARLRPYILLGGLGLELGSIAVLVITRSHSVFGWIEKGDWSTDPKRTIVVEVLTVIALLAVIVFDRVRTRRDHVVPSAA